MKISLLWIKDQTDRYDIFKSIDHFVTESKSQEIAIELKEVKDARSLAQNNWMWGPLFDGFVRLGNASKEDLKRDLQWEFLKEYVGKDKNGQDKFRVKGTSDLDVSEMRHFLDSCSNLLKEIGGYIESSEYDKYIY